MNVSSKQRIASGHAVLATETVGNGTLIVFLHASVCDRRMWRFQQEAIGSRHCAVAYDSRGFGETFAEAEDFSSVADLMKVVNAIADSRQVVLVGCSQGGRIALDAALAHPARILGLVLIAPSVGGAPDPIYPPGIQELMIGQKEAETRSDLARLNAIKARLWLDGALAVEGRVQGWARELFLEMNDLALRSATLGANVDANSAFQRLHEISAPTLVIQGNLDFPHIQERSRHIAAVMPHAALHELPGAAHLPSLEQPAEVTDLIVGFIDRILDGSR